MQKGIRHHHSPFGGFWGGKDDGTCQAEFRTLEGIVTDMFYGACNDFNDWLVAKASKGDKFSLYVIDKCNGGFQRVCNCRAFIGEERVVLHQKFAGTWELQ